MRFIGIDFHKKTSYITMLDKKGKMIFQKQIENTPGEISGFVDCLKKGDEIAVEAVGHWMYLYEQLESSPAKFVLTHPQGTKAIASARLKNDKVDSRMLADLLRADLVPEAYVPPREVRDLREVLRLRAYFVGCRSSVKNRIRSLILKTGDSVSYTNILGKSSVAYLRTLDLREAHRFALDRMLDQGLHLSLVIKNVEKHLAGLAQGSPESRLLMSMPGIGLYSALLILSEIGEPERFRKADQLVSWAGLAPKVSKSSDKVYRGPMTKRGSKFIRWILVEDARHAIRCTKRFKQKYDSVRPRRGHNKAKVAVAASMLRSVHWMLKHNEPFKDV